MTGTDNGTGLIKECMGQFGDIPDSRIEEIKSMAGTLREYRDSHQYLKLIFICTHNSRRSQLAELWMRIAIQFYGLENLLCFSGGTETTSFNYRMVEALKRAGFKVRVVEKGNNPIYQIHLSKYGSVQWMFSKKYGDAYNPAHNFIAVMVCSHADTNCPLVEGADQRISLPYLDPKAYDGSPAEMKAYDDKIIEIGREMMYIASQMKTK